MLCLNPPNRVWTHCETGYKFFVNVWKSSNHLRKSLDVFGNVRKSSEHLRKSRYSEDKNLRHLTQEKLAGIHSTVLCIWAYIHVHCTMHLMLLVQKHVLFVPKLDVHTCIMLAIVQLFNDSLTNVSSVSSAKSRKVIWARKIAHKPWKFYDKSSQVCTRWIKQFLATSGASYMKMQTIVIFIHVHV